jgi:iron complex transport system substrate-binding protein
MKKVICMVAALMVAAALVFTGCAAGGGSQTQQTAGVTPAPKDIMDATVDAMGNEVTAAEQGAELTIISTAPSVTEILFALGCGDEIKGVDVSSDYPAEAAEIEKVGDFNGLDIEKIIAQGPDIVFAGNGLQHESIAKLQEAGITVVAAEPTYFDDIAASITLVGSAVGRQNEAKQLVDQIASAVDAVTQRAGSIKDKPTIYYVMYAGGGENWTSGKGSFINSVMTMAGGQCVTADFPPEWLNYPIENLITADPDILIVSNSMPEADLLKETGFKDLTAIKDHKYYYIDPSIIERPGPRITEALEAIQGYIAGE